TLTTYLGGQESINDIQIGHQMPDIIRLGVAYRPMGDLELRLFGAYERWSLFENMCIAPVGEPCEVDDNGAPANDTTPTLNIRRNWQDAFNIRVGLSYWVMPELEIMAGAGYDSNAIPDENLDPALIDFHDVSTALMGRYQIVDEFAVQLGYTHLFYISRDTSGKGGNALLHETSRSPDNGGTYKQTIGVINVGLQATFDPFTDEPAPAIESAQTAAR
ncbi:MAG: outer membrane protein transport protein, partial [Deltaproteobacteria bacterium]|nr:outer membrane protein transport protein [Deltaproteobacteria bacterium]